MSLVLYAGQTIVRPFAIIGFRGQAINRPFAISCLGSDCRLTLLEFDKNLFSIQPISWDEVDDYKK